MVVKVGVDMEEDIKYLEDLLAVAKMLLTTSQKATIQEREIQAIENLIKEYKELKKLEDVTIETLKDTNYIHNNYIPKSKVRELQDKYKNRIEKLESKKIWNEPIDTINKNRYTNYFNAYEELLQEGDK